jgi:hypothetical protein
MGIALGVSLPELHHGVESAQVLAGIVEYPPESPVYAYHLRIWTLVNQILALLLCLGFSERELSVAVSGAVGMLSFLALALCALAASRDRWLALLAPSWIYFLGLHKLGVCYPIFLLGQPYTFGMMGSSYGLLALALLGLGCRRTGLFLLGLAPAVHATLGSWCLAVGVVSLLLEGRERRAERLRGAGFLAAGLLVSLGSLLCQLWLARGLPEPDAGASETLIRAFVQHWDSHRYPIPSTHPVLGLTLEFLVLCGVWLRVGDLRRELGSAGGVLLRALAISGALGLAAALSTHWLDRLPLWFVVAMPGRYLNLTTLALAPVLLGLVGRWPGTPLSTLLLLAAALAAAVLTLPGTPPVPPTVALQLGLLGCALLTLLRWLRPDDASARPAGRAAGLSRALALALLAVPPLVLGNFDPLVLALVLAASGALVAVLDPPAWIAGHRVSSRPLRAAALSVLLLAAFGLVTGVGARWERPADRLTDWSNDAFLSRVAAGSGALLSAGDLERVQLRTRRSVVLDGGALDGLVYAPGSAPQVRRILRSVYGEDLQRPSRDIRRERPGALLPRSGKALWERRSPEAWTRLAKRYGFTQVLAPAGWRLRLPRVAAGRMLLLYRVPES